MYYVKLLCSLGVPMCNALAIVKKYTDDGKEIELQRLADALEANGEQEGIPFVY